jgi:hypothetical protein
MMRNVVVLVLLVFALAVVAQARVNLQITEIYAGTSPKTPGGAAFDTSEWFEVTNFGATAADMVANPVYYDDESASPTKNTQLLGVDTIAAGESVIFFVDWESDLPGADDAETLALAYSLFATAWGPLTGVQIGYCDTTAGGLGTNGDTMYLFDSNLAGANIIDTAGYTGSATSTYVSQPDGTWNGSDGGPVSNDLAGSGGLAGWPALVPFGDPPITLLGSPGVVPVRAIIPLNPSPADGSSVLSGPAKLQWTLPEPNVPGGVVTCDVYFGTDPDIEANPKVVTGQAVESVSVTLAPLTTYYWALDLYDSSINTSEPFYLSHLFTFNTMNTAPDVNAGDDVAAWLDNGLRVVQLGGVVSDEDGGPGPATLLWTVVAEPNELNPAQISDPLAANPTVTIIEPGSYTLQLEAGDGEFTTTETMQIVLYADSCEHAKNQEGFELIPGDINEDCIVNELDLAILEEHWLEWNYSIE